jgi:hypothetical protein
MRLQLAIMSVAFVAVMTVPARGADPKVLVTVPDDTVVPVQLVQPVTSADNKVGDIFDVRVTEPVNAGGYVIIASNAKGRGHVTKIDRAGGHGHAGTVAVVIDYVYSVDGLKVRLKDAPTSQEGSKQRGGATVAGIFTYGIASNAVKGGEATLSTERIVQTHVDGTVHVTASEKATGPNADAGYAH